MRVENLHQGTMGTVRARRVRLVLFSPKMVEACSEIYLEISVYSEKPVFGRHRVSEATAT